MLVDVGERVWRVRVQAKRGAKTEGGAVSASPLAQALVGAGLTSWQVEHACALVVELAQKRGLLCEVIDESPRDDIARRALEVLGLACVQAERLVLSDSGRDAARVLIAERRARIKSFAALGAAPDRRAGDVVAPGAAAPKQRRGRSAA